MTDTAMLIICTNWLRPCHNRLVNDLLRPSTQAQIEAGPDQPSSIGAGDVPVEPSAARRALLVLGQTLIPYCVQCLSRTYPGNPLAGGGSNSQDSSDEPVDVDRHRTDVLLPHGRLLLYVRTIRTSMAMGLQSNCSISDYRM